MIIFKFFLLYFLIKKSILEYIKKRIVDIIKIIILEKNINDDW